MHNKETIMKMNRLTTLIMIAMVLGVIVGYACNTLAGGPAEAKEIAGYFGILTDIFLRLIKMIIAPLVFATLVAGLAGMGDSKTVGRIGAKALGWFVGASLCSLRSVCSSPTCCIRAPIWACRCRKWAARST
jgi:Na+/H+-dicarboxylate symporter